MGNRDLKNGLFALLCALSSLCPGTAHAANADADVVVVQTLSFIKVDDLDFGSMLSGGTAGTVVVPPSGARTSTGGVTLTGTSFQPARFAGRGTVNQRVQISLNANAIQITRVSGTQTMTVDTFIIGSTPTAPLSTTPRTFTITSPTGIFNFPVGATLRVGANQVPGIYRGSFTVTLNYL